MIFHDFSWFWRLGHDTYLAWYFFFTHTPLEERVVSPSSGGVVWPYGTLLYQQCGILGNGIVSGTVGTFLFAQEPMVLFFCTIFLCTGTSFKNLLYSRRYQSRPWDLNRFLSLIIWWCPVKHSHVQPMWSPGCRIIDVHRTMKND